VKLSPQLLRFGAVGIAGFGVDVAALYLLAPFMNWHLARVLSFLLAAMATWSLNRNFTFAAASPATGVLALGREYMRYLAAVSGGALVNYLVYAAALWTWHSTLAPAAGVALGSLIGMVLNFTVAKHWVFRRRETGDAVR
jgi:putative flippase GtrA